MTRISKWILEKLGRVTTSGKLVAEIDGLRFIAILSVILFHAIGHFFAAPPEGQPPSNLLHWMSLKGWFGVQLFFIISGCILSLPFAEHYLQGKPSISLRKYFLRRVTRLEPPYIINLLALMTLLYLKGEKPLSELLRHFFASMFYMHNLAYQQMSTINHVAWSLEIEVQFYILAPLLCMVFMIPRVWIRRGSIAGVILILSCLYPYAQNWFVSMTLLGQLRFFLLGFLLTDIYLSRWRSEPSKSFWWDLPGLAAWIGLPWIIENNWAIMHFVLPVALLIAYIAAFRGLLLNKFFTNPWIVVTGGMCYSIYLYHCTMIWWVKELLFKHPLNLLFTRVERGVQPENTIQLIALTLIILIACSVLFVLFEKPFMRKDWIARTWQRLQTGVAFLGRIMWGRTAPEALALEDDES
jgi:peptidoglycan/LPS O-acetylase OafA/YrhL